MMKIDLATLFPEMCETVLGTSIVGRARRAGYLDIRCWQIRDYTVDNIHSLILGPLPLGELFPSLTLRQCSLLCTAGKKKVLGQA